MGSSVPAPLRVAATSVALSTLALIALMGCSKTEPAAIPPGSMVPASAAATSSTAATGAGAVVTVKTFTFKPDPIKVKAGEKVTWQNEDDILHEPTAGTPASKSDAFKAVELDGKGSSASVTFTAPGTYPYFCAVHESMAGEIVVT